MVNSVEGLFQVQGKKWIDAWMDRWMDRSIDR